MRPLDLLEEDARQYGWRRHYRRDGSYLDSAGFNVINLFAYDDGMSGQIVATVHFAGVPVLVCRADQSGYEFDLPGVEDNASVQAVTAFLVQIGEANEAAPAWVADHPDENLWDTDLVGDGHELVAFQGAVARGLHDAYPHDTTTPRGW